MTEDIVIQRTFTENGHRQKVVPIYFTSFHVPLELYEDTARHERAFSMASDAQSLSHESSVIQHFANRSYSAEVFYVSTPDAKHTQNIAEAILCGFQISYVIKQVQ